jgi:hypothetical protein
VREKMNDKITLIEDQKERRRAMADYIWSLRDLPNDDIVGTLKQYQEELDEIAWRRQAYAQTLQWRTRGITVTHEEILEAVTPPDERPCPVHGEQCPDSKSIFDMLVGRKPKKDSVH